MLSIRIWYGKASLNSFLQNVVIRCSYLLLHHCHAFLFKIINRRKRCRLRYSLIDLWLDPQKLNSEDVIDHLEFSHMPVEVIMDLPLLALHEPVALSEIVIAHIFAQVECFNQLLSHKLLLVAADVNYHRALATVTHYNSEELPAVEPLFSILVKPVSLLLQVAQLTAVLGRIVLEDPHEAWIRLYEIARLLNVCVSHLVRHLSLLYQIAHHNGS